DRDVLPLSHQECSQTPRDAGRLCGHQRLATVEIALVEADAEPEPGLQWAVQQGEVGAVIPVTLLHPQRVQRSVATWADAKPPPGGHQAVPNLQRDTRIDIEFPSQLADIGHPLSEGVETLDSDLASLHEREAF